MDRAPRVGEDVIVEHFGPAVVVRSDRTTAFVRLNATGIQVQVGHQELAAVADDGDSGPDVSEGPSHGSPRIASGMDRTRAAQRLAIEALRFGLVPESELAALTLNWDGLETWAQSRLPGAHQQKPQASEITGPFGSGKSHAMAAIRSIAKRAGYLTARVEVDGKSVSLSDPSNLLYTTLCSLSAVGFSSATPILDLCLRAIGMGVPAPTIAPRGIDRVHRNYRTVGLIRNTRALEEHGHAFDSVMMSSSEYNATDVKQMIRRDSAIPSSEVEIHRMVGLQVSNRPYDFVEAWVGYAKLAQMTGFMGLVITIDEFEVEHLSPRFDRIVDLLGVISEYFTGKLDHPTAPLALFFATAGSEGSASDNYIDNLVADANGSVHILEAWSADDRRILSERVFNLYHDAYEIDSPYDRKVASRVESEVQRRGGGVSGLTRAFIKAYVRALDSTLGPPHG